MSVKDEFYSLPPEDVIPKEASERRNEENLYVTKSLRKASKAKQENREKQNSLIKMLMGAIVSVTVITNVAGDDIFYRTSASNSISKYELYTRMDSGLVEYDNKTACLTDGYSAHSVGALVSKEPIDLSKPIKLEFDVLQVGYGDYSYGRGADGISVGFSKYENVRGLGGGFLGYDSEFGIEFDLMRNPSDETEGGNDYANDHISILGDSVWHALAVTPTMSLDDGVWHHIVVEYKNSVLYVKYDDTELLQADIENNYEKLYLKIAGATGDGICYQAISNIKINNEILLIDDGHATDKLDYNVITDFQGEKKQTEPLHLEDNLQNPYSDNIPNTQPNAPEFTPNPAPINEVDNKPVESMCLTCNGTGIICPGSIAADDPEGCHGKVIVDCKACNGTGYEASGRTCYWCEGTLKHLCPSFESHYECPDCNGTGRN